MRGCPWKLEKSEVVEFFAGNGEMAEDEIFIEEFGGRRSGSVLVFFESKELAQKAKIQKNKATIGEA